MANPSDKQMLRDANGDLIPQYWDVVAGDFKPLTGSDGAQDTRLTGSNAEKGIPVRVEKDVREVVVRGDELEAGKDQIFDIYADEGEMWTLQRFGYSTSRNQESQGKQSVSLYHGG